MKIFLTPGDHKVFRRREPKVAIVKGGGKHELPIPSADAMVKTVLSKKVKGTGGVRLPKQLADLIDVKQRALLSHTGSDRPVSRARSRRSRKSIRAPDLETEASALINAAEIVQALLEDGAFDYIWDQIFGSMLRIADRARTNPDLAKLAAPMADHAAAVRKMRSTVGEALPKIMKELQEKNPGVPTSVLLSHAMQGIHEQIGEYLQVLELYTTALDQYSSGEDSAELKVINAFMESTFGLSVTGDLDALAAGGSVKQIVPTENLKVGAVVLTGFLGERGGLATIPAALGAVNCNLLLVPRDMKNAMVAFFTLLTHESSHQFNDDLIGFKKEQREIIKRAIKKALSGGLQLSSSQYLIGKSAVDAGGLMVKLFTDWAEEMTADIRGLLGHGVAYALNSLFAFPAFNPEPVRQQDEMLRSYGRFSLRKMQGGAAIEFEPHPTDLARIYGLCADVLDLLGRNSDGDFVRAQALKAIGGRLPEFFSFVLDGKEKLVLKIPAADVLAVSKVVADAIINTKMKALNNGECSDCDLCLRDIVSWDDKRENKALSIATALAKGQNTVPANIGTVFRPYVVSGAIRCLWNEAEKRPVSRAFMTSLQMDTFSMMMECRA